MTLGPIPSKVVVEFLLNILVDSAPRLFSSLFLSVRAVHVCMLASASFLSKSSGLFDRMLNIRQVTARGDVCLVQVKYPSGVMRGI